jgi:hypothetical protein
MAGGQRKVSQNEIPPKGFRDYQELRITQQRGFASGGAR